MREWKQVEDRAHGLLYLKQNSKVFAIPILTPNHYKTDTVRIGMHE